MHFFGFDATRLERLLDAVEAIAATLDRCLSIAGIDGDHDLFDSLERARRITADQVAHIHESLDASFATPPVHRCLLLSDVSSEFQRWVREDPGWWTHPTHGEATRGDDLVSQVWGAADGRVERLGELIDTLPSLAPLVLGTSNMDRLLQMWLLVTDPTTTSTPLAGRRIRRLLETVFDARNWEHGLAHGSIDIVGRREREHRLMELVATITAPWQFHFSGLAPSWNWSDTQGVRRLHQIAADPSAAAMLSAHMSATVHRILSRLPDDPAVRRFTIDAVASSIGTSIEVQSMASLDHATSSSGLDTLRGAVDVLSSDAPWPIAVVVSAGVGWVTDYLDTTDESIRRVTLQSLTQGQILASIAVLAVLSSTLRSLSRRPLQRVIGPTGMLAELDHTYTAIDNAAGRGRALARLTTP